MELQGIILAGGKSSRMGQDKGLLQIQGKSFVEYIMQKAAPMVKDLMIISNNKDYRKFGLPVHGDLIPNSGPAGGIYTGLYHSKHEYNLVMSCDTPLISEALLRYLISRYKNEEAFFFRDEKHMHPLLGIYRQSTKRPIKKAIEKGNLKILDILADLSRNTLNVKPEMVNDLKNINTKEDYQLLIHESAH
jgi:molybdopterin-guanine dinucleotide biosynthesis protein A